MKKNGLKILLGSMLIAGATIAGTTIAKPIPHKYGQMKDGHVAKESLQQISEDARYVQEKYTKEQYLEIVEDPYNNAKTDQEKIAAIAAREIIFMVDRSYSMSDGDQDPTGQNRRNWTLWRSAEEAAISLFEVALALDSNGKLDVVFWDQNFKLGIVHKEITQLAKIQKMFNKHKPRGGTPLAGALKYIYKKKLKKLLDRNEPFTVVVLTDGEPPESEKAGVFKFFRDLVSNHNLTAQGRESLAAFSFIQAGDSRSAEDFLNKLDDDLINGYTDNHGNYFPSIGIDIVDHKKDNFIFGTGTPAEMTDSNGNVSNGGPIAIFWNALFD